ncbi:C40 family peptidase [Rhodococcus sp. BP-349]|uniref:C40 family peptidase n=1 Tax=unclassified Rhodococcus (in: high G+C Gram-positive bacteria) TaxID=192944 RepID=UPI001C9A34CA|nr:MULTISPECIES: C40 family peptidase [unclassified Rhodococcus (in: high G+C Gram-positive bacteria)]MBY6540710.1 C40 family peptidase [Rhodococcus sp. BP-363]MBY6545265.1 C40 family peptidase [Rhodococcus sp. BP-369]MBY6564495.1 C40 family peptidase [Rhodococcus sp. BP-370]MBY6578569.1 C40 family peptidase [Rhodococcus sp. BP-364]MBY6587870.1 C40 family peptidase [Rhodococcus sp. BP-358]
MAKHRKPSSASRPVRNVLVAGALTAGAVAIPAAPAFAAPVEIPGIGTFEVPDQILSQLPPMPQVPALPGPAAPQSSAAQVAVQAAESKVGAPYVYGAAGPSAFDCSGLMKWAYQQAGIELPRTSYDQAAAGVAVSQADLKPGDVVSFYGGSHSGMYVGNGNVVHASTESQPVKIAPLSSMPFDGARRYA